MWFDILFGLGVVVFVVMYVLAVRQGNQRIKLAKDWPVVQATVVERIAETSDPITYGLKVKYNVGDAEFLNVAYNDVGVNTRRIREGDKILVKFDPAKPETCSLLKR